MLDQDIVESTTSLARPLKELIRMRSRRKKIIEREEKIKLFEGIKIAKKIFEEEKLKLEEEGEEGEDWIEPTTKEEMYSILTKLNSSNSSQLEDISLILGEGIGIGGGERKMESKSGNGEPDVVQLLTQCEAELRRTSDLLPFLKVSTYFFSILEF